MDPRLAAPLLEQMIVVWANVIPGLKQFVWVNLLTGEICDDLVSERRARPTLAIGSGRRTKVLPSSIQ